MTSGQYAYLLLRKLQNSASCQESHYRAYLYNFYGDLFNDPSVVITGESYQEFCDLIDFEMDYIAQKGYITPEEVHGDTDYFNSSYILLQNSFAAIGIKLEMDSTSNPTKLTFTLPSGRISVLNNLQGVWNEQIRFVSRLRVTDTYFKQTMSYYNLEEEEDSIDLKEVGANAAGYNTYWNYNDTNQTVEISGNGTLANFDLWKELKIPKVSTMILGAGVYRLLKYSLNSENLVIVDFHGENDPILIEPLCAVDKKLIIYSNNKSMREYDWAKYGVNVEWHNLSEWNE